ncbi:putative serine/threonine kinase [Methanocella paludicola SANAE]|uniref:non-specific serine/threonine protein kinase n=1 Tax=Methanocella paludicola (strain DSM 17711 / JCM 13418 / NBRC 101707 / SANAE) TaxID=304371 RepID=D1YYL5_METPS|nr:RIO1 family regulatory kinase/ATPase [Methanocella paludicola]BAI61537.1 putative serine/threonine kinase [Methanocella paludicola SANAE]
MIDHAVIFRSLKPEELKILRAVENGMKTHEWVSVEDMASSSGLSEKEIDYRLKNLTDLDLLERFTGHYVGYQLKYNGYDILAISALLRRDTINSLGGLVGVGKESVVIAAMGRSGMPLAIKFHREGRTAFKQVKRKREHLVDLHNTNWLYASALAAKHEFEVLKKLYPAVSVPEPFDQNRHAVVMEVVEGHELSRVKLEDPQWYLDRIIEQLELAYRNGYVHGDFSEYNVMVSESGVTIIDWPQAVATGTKIGDQLLERDVRNILTYFSRKYRIRVFTEEIVKKIKEFS